MELNNKIIGLEILNQYQVLTKTRRLDICLGGSEVLHIDCVL